MSPVQSATKPTSAMDQFRPSGAQHDKDKAPRRYRLASRGLGSAGLPQPGRVSVGNPAGKGKVRAAREGLGERLFGAQNKSSVPQRHERARVPAPQHRRALLCWVLCPHGRAVGLRPARSGSFCFPHIALRFFQLKQPTAVTDSCFLRCFCLFQMKRCCFSSLLLPFFSVSQAAQSSWVHAVPLQGSFWFPDQVFRWAVPRLEGIFFCLCISRYLPGESRPGPSTADVASPVLRKDPLP